ncbi:endolytic transglycosylase MltG [Schwartzia sp. (in: firmicutes)]
MPEWLRERLDRLADAIGAFEWPVNMKMPVVIAASLIVISAAVLTGCFLAGSSVKTNPEHIMYVRIEPGMTSSSIGRMLEDKKIIGSRHYFWMVSKLKGADNKYKTGVYRFYPGMQSEEVIKILVEGLTSTVKFTIPEGYNVNQIAERLDEEGIAKASEIKQAAKDFAPYTYMQYNSNAIYRAEGFLFPDTFELEEELSAKEILELMARDFDTRLTPALRARAKEMNLSVYELVTLASLVEKEAKYDEDRPIIAQVFIKRLKMDMPLQSDTTIQYLLDAPKEDVTYADTEIESPYNTYQHYGLPPGPIASPGMDAIEAVLYPADTDYLYFVADRQGHNHFSRTYDEHLAIVERVR